MSSEMKIQIPTQLIEDTIRAELVRQMGKTEDMVKGIVAAAMGAKKDNYSSTPTFFREQVTRMINDEAGRIFREWIEQNREGIRKALFDYLNGDKQKRLKEFAEKLANNVCQYNVSVHLEVKE